MTRTQLNVPRPVDRPEPLLYERRARCQYHDSVQYVGVAQCLEDEAPEHGLPRPRSRGNRRDSRPRDLLYHTIECS